MANPSHSPKQTEELTMHNKKQGQAGEELACSFLQQQGYRILARNYRAGRAEIDIIAMSNTSVCVFAEVKSRASTLYGFPEESVGRSKQLQIRKAAEQYIAEHDLKGDIRFDIISIVWSQPPAIEHFEDAF
jgi:putative endonuclease